VQARYYFGQPVANAQLRWVVNQQPYFSPLRWNDDIEGDDSSYWYGDNQTAEGTLRLDDNGKAQIRIPLAVDDDGRDFSARIEAQVSDAANREVSGRTIVHATFGTFMLSAEAGNTIHRAGEQVQVSVRALDYLGAAQPNVPVALALEHMQYRAGYYREPEITSIATQSATTDASGGAMVTFSLPARTGSFRVRATAPSAGRSVQDDVFLWVPGAADYAGDSGDRYLELLADKRNYQPGESATLIVRGETVTGPVLVTKEGQHVSYFRVLRPSAADAIQVPIDDGDVGDVFVNLVYMREGRLYRAERRLGVAAASRTLTVAVTAQQAVSRPRDPGVFDVTVTDQAGQPVRAQVSLAVIDEAVYGVKPDDTPDPIRFFYRREYSRVGTTFSSTYYFTGYSGRDRLQLTQRKRRPYTLADFKGDQPVQAQVRKDFPDAIHWVGDLVTDATGKGRIAVTYPDALTTWRLTARAFTEDTRAGSTIARTTTTKDLIVRVITPRFLTEGDEVVVPTLVHNYKSEERTAAVSIESAGLAPVGTHVATTGALAGGAERRDDWRFAAKAPGAATVTATAKTESDVDAVELPIPILPFGIRREVGKSGSIIGTAETTTTVEMPEASNPAARSISISLAPSLAGSVLGALDFLTEYPYGCTEQTLSSFLPNLLVTRALTELKLAPTERLSALDRQVSAGLQRLYDFQHGDGGWGWWKEDGNHPFMTAYALWGLDEARRAGVKVELQRIANGARELAHMYEQYPRVEPDLKAYEAYVLQRASAEPTISWYAQNSQGVYSHDVARTDLWNLRGRMSAYGRALLLLLLDEVKDPRGNQLAAELIGEAQTRGDVSWWAVANDPLIFDYAETSIEATAFAVQALVKRDPNHPVIERAVRWMMLNRTAGYWNTTKQTAMAIYGLLGFMQARGEIAQASTVEVFVNGQPAGRHSFTAKDLTASDPIVIAAPAVAGANQVRLVKRDGGTVYWSAAAVYYDTATADARHGSRQLALTRKYALLAPVKVKDRIVYRETPFTGTAKPGDVISVRLTAAGSPEWRYLALEDPLPAGVESIQDTTAYPLEREMPGNYWWYGSRVEYRDAKTVFFQEAFDQGRYEFAYLVKVIAPGQFRAVPAQISPMYVPGVHASSEPQGFTINVAGNPQ
jgi:alpha-2-macroglobulin